MEKRHLNVKLIIVFLKHSFLVLLFIFLDVGLQRFFGKSNPNINFCA